MKRTMCAPGSACSSFNQAAHVRHQETERVQTPVMGQATSVCLAALYIHMLYTQMHTQTIGRLVYLGPGGSRLGWRRACVPRPRGGRSRHVAWYRAG